jgi:hypothetical protein
MQPPSASDATAAAKKRAASLRLSLNPGRTRIKTAARGHAARNILLLFVTGPVVTTQCVPPADAELDTAAMIAAKPSNACEIASASG